MWELHADNNCTHIIAFTASHEQFWRTSQDWWYKFKRFKTLWLYRDRRYWHGCLLYGMHSFRWTELQWDLLKVAACDPCNFVYLYLAASNCDTKRCFARLFTANIVNHETNIEVHYLIKVHSFEMIWIKISDPRYSSHGRLNEPMNPLWTRIHWFIWSTMIQVILDHSKGMHPEIQRWYQSLCMLKKLLCWSLKPHLCSASIC